MARLYLLRCRTCHLEARSVVIHCSVHLHADLEMQYVSLEPNIAYLAHIGPLLSHSFLVVYLCHFANSVSVGYKGPRFTRDSTSLPFINRLYHEPFRGSHSRKSFFKSASAIPHDEDGIHSALQP
jgi:hypothetical protein